MNREWKTAAAAAASGIGAASGRNVAMFYSQMGWASWLGAAAASAVFGLLCGAGCTLALSTGSESLAAACMRRLGMVFGRILGVLHGFLAVIVGMFMLNTAGRMSALALPAKHAYWMGVLGVIGIALLLNMRKGRYFAGFGSVTIAVSVLFFVLLALDPRPVRFYRRFETAAKWSGSVPAALTMAVLHGALWSLLAINGVMRRAKCVKSTFSFGVKCAGLMLMVILPANAAILLGGEKLLSLADPAAALAARWGKIGYYICIFSMELQAMATLSACTGILMGLNAKHDKIPC